MIKILGRAARQVDDHWVGDLLGVMCLFCSGYGALLMGFGAGLK